jgi:LuxR family transcriptional regulator, maltose regulon positive regulatory protein
MARHPIPQVIDDLLTPLDASGVSLSAVSVGSAAWYRWLNEAATRSFAFHSPQGTLTARRERRQGTWYWYAYRTQHGHLRKAYLGKSEELTLTRLNDVATMLATELVNSSRVSNTAHPISPPFPSPASNSRPADLLMTKLYVPPPHLNIVARPRLIERLNAGMKCKLTLIVAPAGWGKTTLLSAWRADSSSAGMPIAWVSLDADDNDPVHFWIYVISALNRRHPGVGEMALPLLHSPQPPSMELVLTFLLNALTTLSTETVLVLDDYHVIETQAIHDALTFLLDHLPPCLHLVLASRLDPPLPLARLRVRDHLTELRVTDLRFTSQEAAVFLTAVMGLPLSEEEIAALETRTEGWIAGLHLAALSMRGREDLAGFITSFTGSHRYVVDYLVEEVLSRQSKEVQTF